MTTTDFTTAILVEQSAKEAFDAINNVRGWWSEQIDGSTDELNAVFKYHYQDVHICKMKIVEMDPGKRVVWLVTENHFKFTTDQSEWLNTKVTFDISVIANKTQIRLTHVGLLPEHECFDICSNAWTHYIQESLLALITTGTGKPNGKDKPSAEVEREFTS